MREFAEQQIVSPEAMSELLPEDGESRDDLLYILEVMERQGAVGITQPVDYRDAIRYKEKREDFSQESIPEGSITELFTDIIFDFDGVLYDSMYAVYKAVEAMLEEMADERFTEGRTPGELASTFISPFQTFYRRFGITFDTKKEQDDFVKKYREVQARINEQHHAPATLFPEVKDVLARLKEAKRDNPNLRVHIISAGSERHIHDVLAKYDIVDVFDQIHAECHNKTTEIKTIADNSGNPDKTVMIGDLPSDIKDAQQVQNVRTIAIARTDSEKERLGMFLPNYVIGDLRDIFSLKAHI